MRGFQGGREQAEMNPMKRLDIVLQDRRRRQEEGGEGKKEKKHDVSKKGVASFRTFGNERLTHGPLPRHSETGYVHEKRGVLISRDLTSQSKRQRARGGGGGGGDAQCRARRT
jgi:hypothetical protein